ncbi:MAG: stage III sporulation protein AE, partial [Christensenellales bacterium]|nr:stage III sporulation protein AE [Christensenellales bacterium]
MRRLAALFLLALLLPAAAAAEKTEERVAQGIESVIDGMDFAAVEDVTLDVPGWPEHRTLEQTVQALAGGEGFSADDVLTAALGIFMREVGALIQMMLSVMLPVVLASLLMHTLSPQSDSLSAMSRSACFVLVLTPVIVTTLGELSHTRQTIVTMTRHMERLLPMLLTLLTALGGSASSAFLHPMVAAASGSMVFLAREVILRLVMCTCAVTAVNHLSDRAHLTRMAQLLRGAVCWLLGVSFTVFLGAMSLQGVTSASIDGVAIRAAKYAVDNFVPVVGGMFSDTMDTLVGCTLIVKNALGVAAVLVLVGALVGPLLRTLAVVFMLRLSAALLEP